MDSSHQHPYYVQEEPHTANPELIDPSPPPATQPSPEHWKGRVFAYRGSEAHGVDPAAYPEHKLQEDWAGGKVTLHDVDPAIDPIPVRIVTTDTKEFKDWRTAQYTVNNVPFRIVNQSANQRRTKVRLFNLGTVRILLGGDPINLPNMGYPLPPNVEIILESHSEIWAISIDGSNQTVATGEEHTVG